MLRSNRHRNNHHHENAPASQPDKPNAKLFPFLLPALTMILILSLFAGAVAIIALLNLCLLGVALRRRCSRRSNHHYLLDTDNPPPRLSSAQLRKLPTTRFTAKPEGAKPLGGGGGGLCVICLEDLTEGEWCRELPDCKHVFHAKCVDTWLAKALACPFCRTTVSLPA